MERRSSFCDGGLQKKCRRLVTPNFFQSSPNKQERLLSLPARAAEKVASQNAKTVNKEWLVRAPFFYCQVLVSSAGKKGASLVCARRTVHVLERLDFLEPGDTSPPPYWAFALVSQSHFSQKQHQTKV